MNTNYFTFIATVVNIAILVIIIIGLYLLIKGIKSFIKRNKELDKKIDLTLKKLEEKD